MKKTIILMSLLLSAAVILPLQADSTPQVKARTEDPKKIVDHRDYSKELKSSYLEVEKDLFRSNELSFDVFGLYATTLKPGLYNDDFGGGLGVNYFFTKYIGVGLDGYAWDGSKDDVVYAVSGNLIFRYPIEEMHLAPYAFIGPGGHFGPTTQVSGQAGAGVEFRFTEHVGMFADARYVLTDKTNDYLLPRVGLRFAF